MWVTLAILAFLFVYALTAGIVEGAMTWRNFLWLALAVLIAVVGVLVIVGRG